MEAVEIQSDDGKIAARLQAVEELSQLGASTGEPDELEAEIEKGRVAE